MARGPDGQGGGAGFSLSDQLFNAESLWDLGHAHSVLPGFDAARFVAEAVPGLAGLGVLDRLEWTATCLARQLPQAFPAMAEALDAAMPPPLDPRARDDDFGRFIHAVPGVLAARHGLADHPERALDLIHAATKRFSMEFAIRPFVNRWPDLVLARLEDWVEDPHYHVRRLVSEGTRPRLPWGKGIALDPLVPLRFLDRLCADDTRFVTRSVANHMNDLSRIAPETVVARLGAWQAEGRQDAREMAWIVRHALRTAVKRGEPGAFALLGYVPGGVRARLEVLTPVVDIGAALRFAVELEAGEDRPVMVDYRLRFHRPKGAGEKVFKLKATQVAAGQPLRLEKRHVLKGNATTFTLYPGPHGIVVQVNGEDVAQGVFDVV